MEIFLTGITLNELIVENLKNNRIVNITKPYSEFGMFRYQKRQDVRNEDLFSYAGRKVFLHLENKNVIGFVVDDVKESIVTWFDMYNGVKENIYLARNGDELGYDHPIYANKSHWQGMINESIKSIKVFTRKTEEGVKNFIDSNEIAILLENSKDNMLISYGSNAFKYPSSMPIVKLEDAPDGFFDGTEMIEL